jgi:hypothetical protein
MMAGPVIESWPVTLAIAQCRAREGRLKARKDLPCKFGGEASIARGAVRDANAASAIAPVELAQRRLSCGTRTHRATVSPR